jgi:PAS domain S-box-containing protein
MTMDATEQVQAFIASIQLTPIATVLTDPRATDNPIIAVNASFEQLSGHAAAQVIGHNCRLLRGADTEPEASAKLRQAVIDGAAAIVELLNYRRDGTSFRNAVMIAPIFGDDGAPLLFVGSQMEVPNGANGPERRLSVAKARLESLTPRQRDVLKLMARGRLNKQIAYELGIADKTVKMHRAALLDALNAPTSADAIRLAIEAGL